MLVARGTCRRLVAESLPNLYLLNRHRYWVRRVRAVVRVLEEHLLLLELEVDHWRMQRRLVLVHAHHLVRRQPYLSQLLW